MNVNTIADLRATGGSGSANFCTVFGYHVAGDGGGGDFYWDSSSTQADNNGTIIKVTTIATGRWRRLVNTIANVKWFGARGNGSADDTAAFNSTMSLFKEVFVPFTSQSYRLSRFILPAGVTIVGEDSGGKIELNGTLSPLVVINSQTRLENILFYSLATNLEWNRADINLKENVSIKRCHFQGFRDTSSPINAWGILITKSKFIIIEDCSFENNSQSDIAIVEGCDQIQVINSRGNNVRLNIEPQNEDTTKEIFINGGNYSVIQLLESIAPGRGIVNILMENVKISTLNYGGAHFKMINCIVDNIIDVPWGENRLLGEIDFGQAVIIGKNLINDPQLFTISSGSSVSLWKLYYNPVVTANNAYERISDPIYGRLLRINPTHANGVVYITTQNRITITQLKKYFLVFTSRGVYSSSPNPSYCGYHLIIEFYNASNTLLSTQVGISERAAAGVTTKLSTKGMVFTAPTGAVSAALYVCNSPEYSSNALDILAISLHELNFNTAGNNNIVNPCNEIHRLIQNTFWFEGASEIPNSTNVYAQYERGDRVSLMPSNGGNYEYVCTQSGKPGTWKRYSVIAT